ncbi:MAG: hypothetical protein HOC77_11190 [Chloroflexi bacterium]|nr:hypothetical protein [Chloroflexota bacterium]
MIDPSAADSLVEVLDAAGSKEFSASAISRLLHESVSALESAKVPQDAIDSLSEAAMYLATPSGTVSVPATAREDA